MNFVLFKITLLGCDTHHITVRSYSIAYSGHCSKYSILFYSRFTAYYERDFQQADESFPL